MVFETKEQLLERACRKGKVEKLKKLLEKYPMLHGNTPVQKVFVCCCCGVFVLFLFCFVLFCFVLFCFVLFCFVLFCFVLFCFVLCVVYFLLQFYFRSKFIIFCSFS